MEVSKGGDDYAEDDDDYADEEVQDDPSPFLHDSKEFMMFCGLV